jgi:hypothetical protein
MFVYSKFGGEEDARKNPPPGALCIKNQNASTIFFQNSSFSPGVKGVYSVSRSAIPS